MNKISVIIPTYNNFKTIGLIVSHIDEFCKKGELAYEIVVIDDKSTDETRAHVTELASQYPIVFFSSRKAHGQTAAIKKGFQYASHKTVCVIDPREFSTLESIPSLISKLQNAAELAAIGKISPFQKLKTTLMKVFSKPEIKRGQNAFPEAQFGNKNASFAGAKGGEQTRIRLSKKRSKKPTPKQSYNHRITRYTHIVYSIGALAIVGLFGAWWFQSSHIPKNFTGNFHSLDILLFALVSYIIWHPIFMDVLTWTISSHIKDARLQKPVPGLSVAFLTTIVPSSESLDLLHKCLPAMVEAHYKHDTWLLDEGNSPEVKAICDQYGVLYFSRKGVSVYNTKSGKFTKTKGGNHNSWYDMYGNAYDIVAQIDTDFVPKKTFLTKTLGYFRDPEVAFVGTPQVYGNTDESIVARGAAEQLHTFYGSVLRGLSSMRMTLLIGANHIIRASALKGVDHYSAHITEDLITGMKLHTKGWKSVYISEPLAIGEGPSTWEAYFSQQMRWAYGCMDIFFKHSPKLFKKMGFRRSIYYFFLQQHYFSGIAMALSITLLSLYFITGVRAADIDLLKFFASYSFIIFICWIMSVWLQRFNVSRKRFGEFQLAGRIISIAAWPVWFLAFLCILTGKKISYKVTPKGEGDTKVRSSISTFYPHIAFGGVTLLGIIVSFFTNNQSTAMIFWAGTSAVLMLCIPFAQDFVDVLRKSIQKIVTWVRFANRVYQRATDRFRPKHTFIHNIARQNSSFYRRRRQNSGVERVSFALKKELFIDSFFLSAIVFLSAILYMHQIGFYSDDWSFIGNFSVAHDQSLWGLIKTAFTPNTLMRPMQNIYDAVLFWSFGTNPFGYQIVNTIVMMGCNVLFYCILRQLKLPRVIALTLPLVYAFLPNYSTDRFWFAVFQANLSMLFYFGSFYAALRGISYDSIWSSQWKIVSVLTMILGALSYEVAVPFYLITILVLLNPAELMSRLVHKKERATQKDIIFILVMLVILGYVAFFKKITTTRLNDHLDLSFITHMLTSAFQVNYGTWIMTLPYIWGQVLALYVTPLTLVVGFFVYALIFWFLYYVLTRPKTILPGRLWMLKFTGISFGVFLLGYTIFFTNNQVGFSPTGIDNRVAIAASIGVAMTLIGVFGFLTRLLLPEKIAKIAFCLLVALTCAGGFFVINALSTFWSKAYADGKAIVSDIKEHHPQIPANSTVILDGVCPYVGPAPVFEAPWDLKGALQATYKDGTLQADIVTPRLKVKKDSLETQIYTSPTEYPYKNLYIYNYKDKSTHQIHNSDEAHTYFNAYNADLNNGCPNAEAGKGVAVF